MATEKIAPAESKGPSEEDEFGLLASQLLPLMHKYPDYYQLEWTRILDELKKAKEELEKGELPLDQGRIIRLFGGLQTRNVDFPVERQKNRIVEDLYLMLNKMAGYDPSNYYDIQKDSLDLAGKHLMIDDSLGVNHLATAQWVRGDRLALSENGKLTGIKIKISENMIASFRLGNFGTPEDIGNMTFVDLNVVASD